MSDKEDNKKVFNIVDEMPKIDEVPNESPFYYADKKDHVLFVKDNEVVGVVGSDLKNITIDFLKDLSKNYNIQTSNGLVKIDAVACKLEVHRDNKIVAFLDFWVKDD